MTDPGTGERGERYPISGVVAKEWDQLSPPLKFWAVGKLLEKKFAETFLFIWNKKPPISKKFRSTIKILSTHNFLLKNFLGFCRKFAVSVEKLQFFARLFFLRAKAATAFSAS